MAYNKTLESMRKAMDVEIKNVQRVAKKQAVEFFKEKT